MSATIRVSLACLVIGFIAAWSRGQAITVGLAPSSAPATTGPAGVSPADEVKRLGGLDAVGGRVGRINGLAVSSDERTIVAACEDGRVHAWDIESGKVRTMTYTGWPATASAPSTMPASSPATMPASAPADVRRLGSVAVSFDGKLVAACGAEGIHVWQLGDGKYLGKIAAVGPAKVSFSRDGKQVKAIVGEEPTTWNVSDKTVVSKDKPRKAPVFVRPVPPTTKVRLMDDVDDVIGEYSAILWSLDDPKNHFNSLVLHVCETDSNVSLFEVTTAVRTEASWCVVAMSPDGRSVAFSVWEEGGVVSGRGVGLVPSKWTYKGGSAPVTALSFSPDNKWLVSGDIDGVVCYWPVKSKAPTAQGEFPPLWNGLTSMDPTTAFCSFMDITGGGEKMISPMMVRVRPKVETDMKEFNKLVADLDSDAYSVRNAAREKLAANAQANWPLLQDAMISATSTEVRTALEVLLSKVERANAVQERYAIRILERSDTDLARESLRRLAAAPEDTNIGKLARAATVRLNLPPASQPAIGSSKP